MYHAKLRNKDIYDKGISNSLRKRFQFTLKIDEKIILTEITTEHYIVVTVRGTPHTIHSLISFI